MLNIHLYGKLRSLAKNKGATDQSVVHIEYIADEMLGDLIKRLNIDFDDLGEIFLNREVAELDAVIPEDNSRIAIFPIGMHLLCGGQHLKGHGYITKKPKETKYWK